MELQIAAKLLEQAGIIIGGGGENQVRDLTVLTKVWKCWKCWSRQGM
jgi:hypothetical protein